MIYINGIGNISPLGTYGRNMDTSAEPIFENHFKAAEPAYREYIDPKLIRRMSRVIKMSVASSVIALKEAMLEKPDAIITGTGLGCLQDTIRFMDSIVENQEQLLNPASFIQSTHNTISGQIALMFSCQGYNSTYAHRNFSFESALLDAFLQLQENPSKNILVGGADELTEVSYTLMKRLGYWKAEQSNPKDFLVADTDGTLAGEGSTYFLLSGNKSPQSYAKIKDVASFFCPEKEEVIMSKFQNFIDRNKVEPEKTILISGRNGDARFDDIYSKVEQELPTGRMYTYKDKCGEYHTSSAFALAYAANLLNSHNDTNQALIFNQLKKSNYSFILIEKC